jgi:hypothetical protein
MIINDPATLTELRSAFKRYEQALMNNDIEELTNLFWHAPQTVRYGIGENLYGIDEIVAFRSRRIGGSPQRRIMREALTVYGTDFGTANVEFQRSGSDRIGRQSQSWMRTKDGWKIVSAHVSFMADHS